MENLGQYIKSIREEKQLTIEAIAIELKLTSEQLNAIESNRLSVLGNYGFVRALVYTYVRYLSADEKIAMSLFDVLWSPQKKPNFLPKTPLKEKKLLISTNFIWLIVIAIIVIVLSTIIWISYSKGYLKRPIRKEKPQTDTLLAETVVKPEIPRTDSLRKHMLKLANTKTNNKTADNKRKKVRHDKLYLRDTTDFVEELIFDNKESPFSERL